ncbi:MAG: hydrogenase expression/formation protein HypE [Nitrososphaerales archaeon]
MASKLVTMAHGAGGSVMQSLIKRLIVSRLGGSGVEVPLEALDDAAVVDNIVLKTDSHTVKPLFFPGGDIGRLAVSGTVNDICMVGGEPLALTAGFILEEGFPLDDLTKIVESMAETCREAGVFIVAGDTKVVEKGALDKFVINTSGIGRRSRFLDRNIEVVKRYRAFEARWLLDSNIRAGDKIILSGAVGDHGIAVLSSREGYGFEGNVCSDVKPLNKAVEKILEAGGVVALKDPTRGGLSNALNEWSEKSAVGILVEEEKIPVHENVRAACEMLGIDPYDVGNEGKMIVGVVKEKAEEVLAALRETPEGREAEIIGEATSNFKEVVLKTKVGGKRIIPPPIGDPVPRIC